MNAMRWRGRAFALPLLAAAMSVAMVTEIHLAVVGNGLIGHGVAQVFAVGGKDVRLIGRREESLRTAMGKIEDSLKGFTKHGIVSAKEAQAALKRIRPTTDMNEAAAATLVVEAVPFEQELQLRTFAELDRICPPPTVLA